MRALFVGGVVDNSEMDLDDTPPPMHYPENTGAGRPRYRLHQIGERGDGTVAYAVYGAPEMADEDITRITEERGYARRFSASPEAPR
ncbi:MULTISPECIES: hypothetical protein [Xanthomonas]|uniref:Uncharacterized protein n=8 Tax=Xanthomonas TaxID=338 RepID=A0AB38E5A6_XANCH|nr:MULTISPECIES: hypothetical protein [Xanthomonas]AQS77617.1 hypothetical protein XPE_16380 [Xanthomonas perforans 91-118]AYO94373.1 hypothetical protein Xcom_04500 [Xanthomonas axonopodis pv. commiphoreae]PPT38844.1 hypothetical protein XabCFBP2524_05290 [Xanthomonas axonopodis pv. begoniae]MBB4723796.1 hypothetical protein [Xanthomonas euvesicatoria]MBB4870674.1 hypothetical protein [Xanthomonas euvesicatoria]